MINKVICILSLVTLMGCSPTMVPLVTQTVDSAGNTIEVVTPHVTEASVAKSQAFYKMHIARDKYIVEATKAAGFKVTFDDEGRIESISSTDMPKFNKLPEKVDEYPAWREGKEVALGIAKFATIAFGIDRFTGMIGGLAAAAAPTFNGPTVMDRSFNTAGGNQEINWSTVNNLNDSQNDHVPYYVAEP